MSDNQPIAAAFGPDGTLLATAGQDVLLWDVSSAWQPRRYGSPLGAGNNVGPVAISADGTTLAAGTDDGTISLWDISDPTRPFRLGAPLTASGTWLTAVTFSPNGRLLTAGDAEGNVTLWDLSALRDLREHLTGAACARAQRGFTAAEWLRYIGPTQPYRQTCAR
jgi:WD40 repeat protein